MQQTNSSELQSSNSVVLEYLQLLRRRKWTVLFCITMAVLTAILLNYFSTPVYEAEATIIYEEPKDTNFALNMGEVFINKSPLVNLIQQLKSRALAREVAQTLPKEIIPAFNLPDPIPSNFTQEKLISTVLKNSITVEMIQGSDILKIKVQNTNPDAAKIITNAYIEKLIDLNIRRKREEISNIRDFVERQLMVFQNKLNTSEDTLREFMATNKMAALSDASTELIKRVTEAEASYNAAKTERMTLEQRQRSIAQKRQELAPTLTIPSSPLAEQLKQKLLELEAQSSAQQVQGGSGDQPATSLSKQKISQVKQELIQELLKTSLQDNVIDPLSQIRSLLQESITLEVDLEAYNAREQALKQIIADYETKLQTLPKQELTLARLIRSRDVNDKIYSILLEKREEARITEAGKIGDIRFIDAAEPPAFPIKPQKRKNLALGFVLGLGLGVGLAFFLESLDTSLKSQEDIKKYLALPVLATIPTVHTNGASGFSNRDPQKSYSEKLLSRLNLNTPLYEAFRTFKINFAFVNTDSKLKTILVTSVGAGEGKTFIALNLSQVFAKTGVKTVLVDCDLRRPMVHRALGIKSEPGLTDLLIKNVEMEDVIRMQEIANCYVLPCGTQPPNPSEILESQRMRELLSELKNEYDLIILDAPPLLPVTDSIVLSNEVDGVCLVIRSGKTDRDMAHTCRNILENARAKIIGTILNAIDLRTVYGPYYHDYYRYYKDDQGLKEKRNRKAKRQLQKLKHLAEK